MASGFYWGIFLLCPECTYETKEKTIFKYHQRVTTESDNNDTKKTNMYNPNDIEKYINENYTFIFTLSTYYLVTFSYFCFRNLKNGENGERWTHQNLHVR